MLRKWIKRILVILASLIVMILVAGYIPLIAHKPEIRAYITDTFTEKMSGRLEMSDTDFTVFDHFPNFTVRIENMKLFDSASAARGDTLFTAGEISAAVNLVPLIAGSIQFSSIKISDASIHMVKDSSGRMNVSTLERRKIFSCKFFTDHPGR